MIDKSIINVNGLGQFAKPVEKLIERVSAGIGVLYEPMHIRRKAKAEADAKEIEAQSQIAVNRLLAQADIKNRELGQRALTRLVQEETKSQQNMEDVLKSATRYLNEDAEPEKIEDDWLTHFFSKCRMVSDREMQDLWSKILAGEANQVGSFSKRTVEFVSTISKSEAEVFTRLCRHVWWINRKAIPLVFDTNADLYKNNGIYFSTLNSLESLGLIHFQSIAGYQLKRLPDVIPVSYYDDVFKLTIPENKKGKFINVGRVLFSPMGRELFRITQVTRVEGTVEYVLEQWFKEGYLPASPWPKGSKSSTNRKFTAEELVNLIGNTLNKVKAVAPKYGLQMLVGFKQMTDSKNVVESLRLVPDKSTGIIVDHKTLTCAAAFLKETLDPLFAVAINDGEHTIHVTWLENLGG